MTYSDYYIDRMTDPAELARVAGFKGRRFKIAAAFNPHTPGGALLKLSKDEDFRVRSAAAENPSLPEAGALSLISRGEIGCLYNLLRNPKFSEAVILAAADLIENKLDCVSNSMVEALCVHPSVPLEVLERFAKSDDPHSRNAALSGFRKSKGMLALEDVPDHWRDSTELAYYNADWSRGLLGVLTGSARMALASNDAAPPDILEMLAADEDSQVRAAVAANCALAEETIARLASDEIKEVRAGAARNISAPPDLLAVLAEDLDDEVRAAALENMRRRGAETAAA